TDGVSGHEAGLHPICIKLTNEWIYISDYSFFVYHGDLHWRLRDANLLPGKGRPHEDTTRAYARCRQSQRETHARVCPARVRDPGPPKPFYPAVDEQAHG